MCKFDTSTNSRTRLVKRVDCTKSGTTNFPTTGKAEAFRGVGLNATPEADTTDKPKAKTV